MSSIFDYDGILRESYENARSLATQALLMSQQKTTLAALGVGTVYFLTASVASDVIRKPKSMIITSPQDVIQYGVGGAFATFLTTYLWTPKVTELRVTQSMLRNLPGGVGNLGLLQVIDLTGNHIIALPSEIGRLTKLRTLNVSNNMLTGLPTTLGSLTSLVELNAMGNQIESLNDTAMPTSLRILGLKDNQLKELPKDFFSGLVHLEQLYLTGNQLVQLPDSICDCPSLIKIQASHNLLTCLPERLGALHKLELLRVACCNIAEVPGSLMDAQSLSWLSIAGNPCCGTRLSQVKITAKTIEENDILMGKKLGDGASGEVFEAEYHKKKVAYKIFRKDELSPDGHCHDEIQIACMLHDDNLAKGTPLAEKPNFESLLRCRWKDDQLFSISFVLKCLSSVSGALHHMHSRCIAHGDVYAHNVLASEGGDSILCDYGASFSYTRNNKNNKMFELHEVRAFGLLVRDLIERIDISFVDMEVAIDCQKQLLIIAQQCLSTHPIRRPTFADLHRKLKTLEKAALSSGRTPRSDSRFWLNRNSRTSSERGAQTVR